MCFSFAVLWLIFVVYFAVSQQYRSLRGGKCRAYIQYNAALLCIQILATEDGALAEKLAAKRAADSEKVLKKDAAITAEFNN